MQVILNPKVIGKYSSHPRLLELLDLVKKIESRPEEPSRMFFFDLERSLSLKTLQIYFISLDNLARMVADSKLPKVPDPLSLLCGFFLRAPVLTNRPESKHQSRSRGASQSVQKKRPSILPSESKNNRSLSNNR